MSQIPPQCKPKFFPAEKPEDWPFKTWMDPLEWQALHTHIAWLAFFGTEIMVQQHLDSGKLGAKSVLFGFESETNTPARLTRRGDTIYIALDWRIFMQCFVIASTLDKPDTFPQLLGDDSTLVSAFYKSINAMEKSDIGTNIQASEALVNFIVFHEISHLLSGHLDIVSKYLRKKPLTRVLEFSADHGAFFNTFFTLIRPYLRPETAIDEMFKVSRRFGYVLAVFLMIKEGPERGENSLYPSFYERLLLIMGQTLVVCGKGTNSAHDAMNLIKGGVMSGIRSALFMAAGQDRLKLPANFASLANENISLRRFNCLSCNKWACQVYQESLPSTHEVLALSDLLAEHSMGFYGFDRRSFNLEELYSSRHVICRLNVALPTMRVALLFERIGRYFQRKPNSS